MGDHKTAASVVLRRVSAHTTMPDVRVITVKDRLAWNNAGAKNLIMHAAQRCRVVMLDNDYIVPETFASELRAADPNGSVYRLERRQVSSDQNPIHPGIMYTT